MTDSPHSSDFIGLTLIKLVLLLLGSCVIYFGALGIIELIHDITHPDDDGGGKND